MFIGSKERWHNIIMTRTIKLLMLFLLAVIGFQATSCAPFENNDLLSNEPEQLELNLFTNVLNEAAYDYYIKEFKKEYPYITVNVTSIGDITSYINYMRTDLPLGNAADVIFFNSADMYNIYRLAENGLFYDINELDKQYGELLAWDNYNEIVIEAGFIDGKQLIIPIKHSLPTLATTKDFLSDNDIRYGTGVSLEEFTSDIMKLFDKKVQGDELVFTNSRIVFNAWLYSLGCDYTFVEHAYIPVLNDKFYDMLDLYLKLYPVPYDPKLKEINYLSYASDMLGVGDTMFQASENFVSNYTQELNELEYVSYFLSSHYNKELVLLQYPNYDATETSNVYVSHALAIFSQSNNLEAAYKFVCFILNYSNKTRDFDLWNLDLSGVPVNKKYNNELIDFYSDASQIKQLEKWRYHQLSGDFLKNYSDMLNNVGKCILFDSNVSSMVNMIITNIESGMSINESIENYEKNIKRYLSE